MSELAVQLWTKTTGLPLPQSFLNKLAPSLVTMNGFRIVFAAGVFVFAPSACAGPLAATSPAPAATDTTDFRTFRLCITLLRKIPGYASHPACSLGWRPIDRNQSPPNLRRRVPKYGSYKSVFLRDCTLEAMRTQGRAFHSFRAPRSA